MLGFALLIAAIAGTAWLAQSQQRAVAAMTHSLDVQNRLTAVLAQLQDAETGQRGYLLTGRPEFLEPYNAAPANLDRDLDGLDAAIAGNPEERALAAQLRSVANERQTLLRGAIDRYRNGGPAAAPDLEQLQQGEALMDALRGIIAAMRANEQTLLNDRRTAAALQARLVTAGLLACGLLAIALGIFTIRDGRRRLADVATARDALAMSNRQLSDASAGRAAAEAQIRQMQKREAMAQLTGGIVHDFNNMLGVVLGSLELAKRRFDTDRAKCLASIGTAIEAALRAAVLTGRLMAFPRQQQPSPQPLDVNTLVGGMAELLHRTIGEHVRLETVLADGLWHAYADPGQLEIAILNLCVNARDAMPEGGRLTIETSNAYLDDAYAAAHAEVKAGQHAMISVTDTGIGMSPEVIERAFDPYFTTKEIGKHSGIGLAQVRDVIRLSHGHVEIDSEPGIGTTVKLYLPRHSASATTEEASGHRHGDLTRAPGNEVILVVEDDDRVRHASVDSLRELGYTVVQAGDAVQALAVLETQPHVDLLFTDLIMPDMNGRRLAERAVELRPHLRVLYTTGYTRNAVEHNGVFDTGVGFLQKPFTMEQLATKVRQVLATVPDRSTVREPARQSVPLSLRGA